MNVSQTKTDDTITVNSSIKQSWKPKTLSDLKFSLVESNQIGNGTFGRVLFAMKHDHTYIAIKELKLENEREGFPSTAVREIKILQSLKHKNIVQLLDVVSKEGKHENGGKEPVYMVFEYLDYDLAGILTWMNFNNISWNLSQKKYIFREILEGVCYLHQAGIIHRDLKGANVLINTNGDVKLADFGLARSIEDRPYAYIGGYTNAVVTLWYRAPELLLGQTHYNFAVDMWSVGCILVDILTHQPAFCGNTEIEQIHRIYRMCGSPTEKTWKNMAGCDWFFTNPVFKPKKIYPNRVRTHFLQYKLPPAALDLLENLLVLDPSKRLSAKQCLKHPFLIEDPQPERNFNRNVTLPGNSCHDFEANNRFKKKKKTDRNAHLLNS